MTTIENFTTVEEAALLVAHFLGNRLAAISLTANPEREQAEKVIRSNRGELSGNFARIGVRLLIMGYLQERARVGLLYRMVQKGNLADELTLEAIHRASEALFPSLAEFRELKRERESSR